MVASQYVSNSAHKGKSLTSGQWSLRADRKLNNKLLHAIDMFNKSAKFDKNGSKTLACRVHTKCGLIHSFTDGRTHEFDHEFDR